MKKKDVIFSVILLSVAVLMFLTVRFAVTGHVTIGSLPTGDGETTPTTSFPPEQETTIDYNCLTGLDCQEGYSCQGNIDDFILWPILCDSFDDSQTNCENTNYQDSNLCFWTGDDCMFTLEWAGKDVYVGGIKTTWSSKDDPTNGASFRIRDLYNAGIPVVESKIYEDNCIKDVASEGQDDGGITITPEEVDDSQDLEAAGDISGVVPISSCSDLKNIENDLSGNYELMKNITDCINKENYFPIEGEFKGTLEGNYYTINGLTIISTKQYGGLFERVGETGEIRNLNIESASLDHKGSTILSAGGILVGRNKGLIENCHIYTSELSVGTAWFVVGDSNLDTGFGGLIGVNHEEGVIIHSSVELSTFEGKKSLGSRNNRFGGLVGNNRGIINGTSYSIVSSIDGGDEVGGLVGRNTGLINMTYSIIKEFVVGKGNIGGLIGSNNGGTVSNSYSTGKGEGIFIEGKENVGGLVGSNINTLAGVVELILENPLIEDSYSANLKIIGSNNFGGLVGKNGQKISNSFCSENYIETEGINSKKNYGNLVGQNTGNIEGSKYYLEPFQGCANKIDSKECNYTTDKKIFYKSSSEPLTSWDFENLWTEEKNPNSYPSLKDNYQSTDCSYVQNNLADNPELDRKCVSENLCVYEGVSYSVGEKILHDDLVRICSSNLNWTINLPQKNSDSQRVIKDCFDLQSIQNDLTGNYVLNNNISCDDTINWNDGKGFLPIDSFSGSLDGKGYTIEGLYINQANKNNIGLFKEIKMVSGFSTKVKDIYFSHATIIGNNYVGGVAATSLKTSNVDVSITKVHFISSSIEGNNYIGGLFGSTGSGTRITDSSFEGTIDSSGNYIGGLTGELLSSSIVERSSSEVQFDVNGNSVGGLVGVSSGSISSSFVKMKESDVNSIFGGLVGKNEGTIEESYVEVVDSMEVGNTIGGLAGVNEGSITDCFVMGEGTIRGNNHVGGLVGINGDSRGVNNNYLLSNSYAIDVQLESTASLSLVGGLVADNYGSIENSFASDLEYDLNNEDSIYKGTLIGNNFGTVNNIFIYDRQKIMEHVIGNNKGTVGKSLSTSYFYNASKLPMKGNWDFSNTWKEYSSTYPKLLAFPVEECNVNADCSSSQDYCEDNQCVSKLENFEDCSENYMCESGLCGSGTFLPNYCYDNPSKETDLCTNGYILDNDFCVLCTEDEHCGGNAFCEDYKCVDGCTVETADEDCNSNQFCLSGRCTDKRLDGNSCNNPSQCRSDVCSDGECVQCFEDEHCDSNQYCEDNVCETYVGLLGGCNDETNYCDPSLDCNPLGFCSQQYLIGQKICANNYITSYNGFEYFCVECTNSDTSKCDSDEICDDGRCRSECSIEGVDLVNCGEDAYCNGTQCVSKLIAGSDCIINKEEIADWMCKDNICLEGPGICAECISDDNCSDSEFCDADNVCQTLLAGGQSCTDKNQCQSNDCNLFGKCVECNSFKSCDDGFYCEDNSCNPEKGLWDTCDGPNQCSDGYYCIKSLGYCSYPISGIIPPAGTYFMFASAASADQGGETGSLSQCALDNGVSSPEGYCVQCTSTLNCISQGSDFCASNYLCQNDSYLERSISFNSKVLFDGFEWNNNQLIYDIKDNNINIRDVNSDYFDMTYEVTSENLIINLSIKSSANDYGYTGNSTLTNEMVLKPEDEIRLNLNYNDYNTIIEIPVNFTLRCDTQGMIYNFTYLDNQTQNEITYYCYDGEFCGADRPCAVITSPSGPSQTYRSNITLDFLKYVNNPNFKYYWFSDRLTDFPTTKKNVSEASVLKVYLDILGPIKLGLNVSQNIDEIEFISSTENPSCYIDEDNNSYWIWNSNQKSTYLQDGSKVDLFCDNDNYKLYGTCCPENFICEKSTGDCIPSEYSASSIVDGSTCSQITAAENCRLAEWNSSFDISDLDIVNCSVPVNVTLSDGTNRTVRYNCDCTWDSSSGECATSYTTENITYCLADSDCDVSKYCSTDGICENIEDYCTEDGNCSSWQFCNTNESLCENQEDYCYDSGSCSDGKVCITHLCDYCSEDDDCKSGYYCSTSTTNNYCVEIPSSSDDDDETPTYNNYNSRNTDNDDSGSSLSGSSNNSDNLKWLWLIPTVIFLGVIVLIIFILKKHNVKKNKFDTDDYKKSSNLPPTPPTSPFNQFSAPPQNPIRAPPRRPVNQQFPPRVSPTSLPPQQQNQKPVKGLFRQPKEQPKK